MNFGMIGQVVSEKAMFANNGYVHVYSPGAGADNPLGSNVFSSPEPKAQGELIVYQSSPASSVSLCVCLAMCL